MKKRNHMNIEQGDPLIPILNLVCMLIPLLLYGAVFVKFKVLDVKAPRIAIVDGESEKKETLRLTVMVSEQGFHINVNPKYRKAWMSDNEMGPEIPKTDNGFDLKELNKKLWELKREHGDEQRIFIGAEDAIPYEVLIKTMDYTRGSNETPLFPVVQLTRGLV